MQLLYCIIITSELVLSKEMTPDRSRRLSEYGPQLAIPIYKSTDFKLTFEAKGDGGLRLDLMKTLTDFSYYISIVINEKQVDLRYIGDYNADVFGTLWLLTLQPAVH